MEGLRGLVAGATCSCSRAAARGGTRAVHDPLELNPCGQARLGCRLTCQHARFPPTLPKSPQPRTTTGPSKVARARLRGERVIGEPVASGLALNESWMWHPDFKTAAQWVLGQRPRDASSPVWARAHLGLRVWCLVAWIHPPPHYIHPGPGEPAHPRLGYPSFLAWTLLSLPFLTALPHFQPPGTS